MPSVARFSCGFPVPSRFPGKGNVSFPLRLGRALKTSADLQDHGLVTITLDGITLLAFQRDIMERAKPVDDRRVSLGA
jgi:hypothetical protein